MKRSKQVTLGLVQIVAAWWLAGCGDTPPTHQQVCVDPQGAVVDDLRCQSAAPVGQAYVPIYHYYYAPYRTGGYALGYHPAGGTFVRPAAPSTSIGVGRVVRGGFGATAAGHGSGAGE